MEKRFQLYDGRIELQGVPHVKCCQPVRSDSRVGDDELLVIELASDLVLSCRKVGAIMPRIQIIDKVVVLEMTNSICRLEDVPH